MGYDFMVVKSYSGCEIMAGAPPALAPRSPHALVASSLSRVAERGVEPQWSPEPPTRHTRHTQQADTRRERESLFRWSVLGVLGVLGARQLALPGGAEQPSLHASAAEDLPSPGSARRREAANDKLLSRAYGTAAAPDRAHDRAYADLLARDRTVQPLAHRRSLNPARLPRNACALARATLAAPLLSADLAIRSTLSLYRLHRRHERSGSGRRSATARPQLVRDASRRWARHL